MKRFHVCVNIENALKQRSLNFFEDDLGNPLTTKFVKKTLREEKAKGKKYFTGCDHTDAEGRCLGHDD